MRLFVAADISDDIRSRIYRFLEGVAGFAPDARWVKPQSLHITLKFIGEQSPPVTEQVGRVLSAVKFEAFDLTFAGYGFFPSPQRPRTFWIGMNSAPSLASLAAAIDQALVGLGIAKETHAFSPHITLARATGSSGAGRQRKNGANRQFDKLQEKLAALPAPEFGTMTAHAFFLYESRLSAGGSTYTKIASFESQ